MDLERKTRKTRDPPSHHEGGAPRVSVLWQKLLKWYSLSMPDVNKFKIGGRGHPPMHNYTIKRLSFVALVTSFLTFAGWAALHLVPQKQDWHWVIYPGGLLAMPGVLFTVAMAIILSPQGGHGADNFSWLVAPVNSVFYFIVFFFLFQGKKSPQAERGTGAQDNKS